MNRAGHVQGPCADRERSAPADRGHADRGARGGAQAGYIYIRGEYRYLIEIMDKAIAEAYAKGWLGKNINGIGFRFRLLHAYGRGRVRVRRGVGAAGVARRQARHSADPAAVSGGCRARGSRPTVLNNVETFCAVPPIILNGGAVVRRSRHAEERRHALFCLSGHVNKPGVYELPLGFNLLRMINEVGGGISEGQEVEGRRARRIVLSGADAPKNATSRWITTASPRSGACWGRAA